MFSTVPGGKCSDGFATPAKNLGAPASAPACPPGGPGAAFRGGRAGQILGGDRLRGGAERIADPLLYRPHRRLVQFVHACSPVFLASAASARDAVETTVPRLTPRSAAISESVRP